MDVSRKARQDKQKISPTGLINLGNRRVKSRTSNLWDLLLPTRRAADYILSESLIIWVASVLDKLRLR